MTCSGPNAKQVHVKNDQTANHRRRPTQPGNNGHVCTPRVSTCTLAEMSSRKTTNEVQPLGAGS